MPSGDGSEQDWRRAGHAFGIYIIEQWPDDRTIDDLYQPLEVLVNFMPVLGSFGNQIMVMAWMYARFPDVIAAVPKAHVFAFIEGAYSEHFLAGYWYAPGECLACA